MDQGNLFSQVEGCRHSKNSGKTQNEKKTIEGPEDKKDFASAKARRHVIGPFTEEPNERPD